MAYLEIYYNFQKIVKEDVVHLFYCNVPGNKFSNFLCIWNLFFKTFYWNIFNLQYCLSFKYTAKRFIHTHAHTHTHIYIPTNFQILFHYRLSQDDEYSSPWPLIFNVSKVDVLHYYRMSHQKCYIVFRISLRM